MKKLNFRLIFCSLLMVASLCSYVYLSTISCQQANNSTSNHLLQVVTEEQPVEEQKDIYLPDVQFLKKAFELTKRMIQITPGL